MIDMSKEIIFRDGWTLNGKPPTNKEAACAFDAINLGYKYGLKLDQFYWDDEMIHFDWRGTKQAVTDWFTYVSTYMGRESEEDRNKTLKIIADK